MPQRDAPRAGRATAVGIGRVLLQGCGPAWYGTASWVASPRGEFHVDNCLSASCRAAPRHLLLLFCSKSIHLQTEMRTSWWLLGFILEKKIFCKALFCFEFLFPFPSAQEAGFVGLPLSACPRPQHGSSVLGPSVAPVGKARVTFLPRLGTGELVQTLFVGYVFICLWFPSSRVSWI